MNDFVRYNGAYNGPQVDAAVSRALSGGALDREIDTLKSAVGSPLQASTVAGMTDIKKIYVYTGTEVGYTAGHWYYWNGAAWTDGGVYNAVSVDNALSPSSTNAIANKAVYDGLMDIVEQIAPEYDITENYDVGNLASHDGTVYVCVSATSGAWDSTKWSLTTVAEQLNVAVSASWGAYPHAVASGSIVSFTDGADGIPVRSFVAQIFPVQAAGTPTPSAPKSVTGWTGASVVRAGKNLLNPSDFADTTESGGVFSYSGSGTLNSGHPIKLKAGSYTLSLKASVGGLSKVTWRLSSGAIGEAGAAVDASGNYVCSFVLTEAATIGIKVSNATTFTEPQLELGERTAYTEWIGDTYDIIWTDAGTVYYGTLTNNGDGTWTLVDEGASITFDGGTVAVNRDAAADTDDTIVFYRVQSNLPKVADYTDYIISPSAVAVSIPARSYSAAWKAAIDAASVSVSGYQWPNQAGNNFFYFGFNKTDFPTITDAASANAWLENNNITVYFRKATGTQYTLTEDSVKTLLGDNNIWCDTGSVSVDYRADTTLYIDGKVAALMALISTN